MVAYGIFVETFAEVMQKCFVDAFNQKILVLQNILGREADFSAPVEKIDGETHSFSIWQPLRLSSSHHLHYKGLCAWLSYCLLQI